MTLPQGLSPDLIGKVVIVQIFKRSVSEPDTILPDSLEKYVGTLQTYYSNADGFAFSLTGDNGPRAIAYKQSRIEFYKHTPKYLIG